MQGSGGWTPLRKPAPGSWVGRSPFARLALTHVLAVAGDTFVTMALAGSLFFSISPGAARGRVALYLLLTMAPFAVVAPLIGPALDRSRGGRRSMLIAASASRAVVCLSMAGHLHSAWLFPEAFAVLVLSKAHMVTKSALVPTTVAAESELVAANSRLALLSVLAGFAAALPGIVVLKIGFLGAPWVVRLAAVAFAASAVAASRIYRAPPQAESQSEEKAEGELRVPSVRMAATAMAVLRGIVGFLTFLVAFSFRRTGAPSWWFGAVLAASMAGSFLGAGAAAPLRRVTSEERMLLGSLLVVGVVGGVAGWVGGLGAISLLAATLGMAAGAGKQAFDSIVQRDAPDAVRGRTFARFETRFQIFWVLGAAVPVLLRIPSQDGMNVIGLAATLTFLSYCGGLVAAAHRSAHFTST